jgi:putative hydrolase of the HAD superfamily
VPLLEDTLGEVFPEVVEIFGANIYFSCSLGIGKPDPEIYRQVAGACGTAPERCLFTDDKLENVEGARAAGMQGIHFTAPASFLQQLDVIGVALDWGVNRP